MKRRVFPKPEFIFLALLPFMLACTIFKGDLSQVLAPDNTPVSTQVPPTATSQPSPTVSPDNPPVSTQIPPTATSQPSPTVSPDNPPVSTQIPPTATSQPSPTITSQPSPTMDIGKTNESIRQWAADAEASSEYGSTDWSAYQAVGEPNTPVCGDEMTAWASANPNTIEWLDVYFKVPVYPSEIRIIQTYYPDQVSQVDLIDMQGNFVTVYTRQPRQVETPCPYTLSIPVNEDTILVQGVSITIDQTVVQYWNEIDAVEIIGIPEVEAP